MSTDEPKIGPGHPLWPICTQCEKPVERMSSEEDPKTHDLIVTAYCHGDSESARIKPEDAIPALRGRMRAERAFTTRRLSS